MRGLDPRIHLRKEMLFFLMDCRAFASPKRLSSAQAGQARQ
jgi:hypothetical protein